MATLARVSIPGKDEHGGPSPDPRYGGQIQTLGLMGVDPRAHGHGERVRPEADVNIRWVEQAFAYPDGTAVSLRAPELEVRWLEGEELRRFGPPEELFLNLNRPQDLERLNGL